MIDMKGKVAVVFGLANKRSIAYAIAEKLSEAGATLVLCYQSERLREESEELIEALGQAGNDVEVLIHSDDRAMHVLQDAYGRGGAGLVNVEVLSGLRMTPDQSAALGGRRIRH